MLVDDVYVLPEKIVSRRAVEDMKVNQNIMAEVMEQINSLPYEMQKQVLNFIKELKHPKKNGIPGKDLLRFAGSIPLEDLKMLSEAIERDCGRVD